jgi:hypothetical protein
VTAGETWRARSESRCAERASVSDDLDEFDRLELDIIDRFATEHHWTEWDTLGTRWSTLVGLWERMFARVENERDEQQGIPQGEGQYWDDAGKSMMAQLEALRRGHRKN